MVSLDDYVIDVSMRDLVGHDRRVVSFLALFVVCRRTKKRERRRGELPEHCRVHRSIEKLGAGCCLLAHQKKIAGFDEENGNYDSTL